MITSAISTHEETSGEIPIAVNPDKRFVFYKYRVVTLIRVLAIK